MENAQTRKKRMGLLSRIIGSGRFGVKQCRIAILLSVIFALGISLFNTGCAVYFSGFKPIVSPSWDFPSGIDTCDIFVDLEGGRTKEAFKDSSYRPCFTISDGGELNNPSLAAIKDIVPDSVVLRYLKFDTLVSYKKVSFKQRFWESKFRDICYDNFLIPPKTDTVWLTLYIHTPVDDSITPFARTWTMIRDDWKVRTLLND